MRVRGRLSRETLEGVQDHVTSLSATGSGTELLDSAVAHVVRETGASVAMLYLLSPDDATLHLAVLAGVPGQLAHPWTRVPLSAPIPVADAVRLRCLIWLGSQEELARRYPRPALVLPYQFALGAAPIHTGSTARGGLTLLWPGSHSPHLAPDEREAVVKGCHGIGILLQQAESSGYPILPGTQPRVLPPPEPEVPGPAEATAVAEFVRRLPGGSCALAIDGTVVFINDAAAGLLGTRAEDVLGTLPWDSLPWLDNPAVEDHYRAAVIGRQQTSFTVLRPPDRWLSFHLFPSNTGISVRIVPTSRPGPRDIPAPALPTSSAVPSRATALYHLMHLAATLTEAVGTRDVIELTADQLMPAFRIQTLVVMTSAEGRLRIEGARGSRPALMERFDGAPLTSATPAAHVLMTGIPDFYPTFTELDRAYPSAGLRDVVAASAFLPLIVSGHPVGSLVLAYDRPRSFDPEERALLTSIAGLLAQALDRARLYDTKDRLAHSLQAHLLPQTLPAITGLDVAARYLPSTRGMGIGGDFYDLIRLDDTTAAAAIGDVQGHNENAAALMGQVRTAVHASAGCSARRGPGTDQPAAHRPRSRPVHQLPLRPSRPRRAHRPYGHRGPSPAVAEAAGRADRGPRSAARPPPRHRSHVPLPDGRVPAASRRGARPVHGRARGGARGGLRRRRRGSGRTVRPRAGPGHGVRRRHARAVRETRDPGYRRHRAAAHQRLAGGELNVAGTAGPDTVAVRVESPGAPRRWGFIGAPGRSGGGAQGAGGLSRRTGRPG